MEWLAYKEILEFFGNAIGMDVNDNKSSFLDLAWRKIFKIKFKVCYLLRSKMWILVLNI